MCLSVHSQVKEHLLPKLWEQLDHLEAERNAASDERRAEEEEVGGGGGGGEAAVKGGRATEPSPAAEPETAAPSKRRR